MAQTVETIIEINGNKLKQFSSLKLSQGIYAHHSFRLVCPIGAVDENVGVIFNESTDLIGAPVHIKVTSEQEESALLFSGLITQVEASCSYGHPGNLIISGFSPTILLENGPHCKSWLRNSVKSMTKGILGKFPADWLKYSINPAYKETLHYTVQYRETDWQFIKRLAAAYGEWLYYDGQKLVMGALRCRKFNLNYGIQISRFAREVQLKPAKVEQSAYDYVNNKVYNSRVENSTDNSGHNDVGVYALKKGAELYEANPACWHTHTVRNKVQLDNIVHLKAAMQISDVIRMHGSSDLPGFQPGDVIVVKASNTDDQADRSLGDYRIISIDHCWDGIGNYANEFVAIPASVKVPPIAPVLQPYCEKQNAVVVENHDAEGIGRLKVRFLWMDETQESAWVRVATLYAGKGKGLFMMPEIGEEVIVDFVGGDATQPYVTGTVHNGNAKTEFGSAGNDIKAIQTRSGIKVLMNDKEGSISSEDKNGNGIKMDGDGTVTMKSKDKMVLVCGESKIILNKDGTVEIRGSKVKIDATEEVKIYSNDHANINAATKVAVKSTKITLN